jgi:Na+-transporting methylmalonyl-CoA/oxaloacetate decarboxylase gamma subunit
MVVKSIIFCLMAYGFAIVIAFFVAMIVKGISLVVQRGKKTAAADDAKE